MNPIESRRDVPAPGDISVALPSADVEGEGVSPWELVDTGRYRPRRIRGSYRGRELG
jgi:hypothetical protein